MEIKNMISSSNKPIKTNKNESKDNKVDFDSILHKLSGDEGFNAQIEVDVEVNNVIKNKSEEAEMDSNNALLELSGMLNLNPIINEADNSIGCMDGLETVNLDGELSGAIKNFSKESMGSISNLKGELSDTIKNSSTELIDKNLNVAIDELAQTSETLSDGLDKIHKLNMNKSFSEELLMNNIDNKEIVNSIESNYKLTTELSALKQSNPTDKSSDFKSTDKLNTVSNEFGEHIESIKTENLKSNDEQHSLNTFNVIRGQSLNNNSDKKNSYELSKAQENAININDKSLSDSKVEIKEAFSNKDVKFNKEPLKTNDNEVNINNVLNGDAAKKTDNEIIQFSTETIDNTIENRNEFLEKLTHEIKEIKEGDTSILKVSLKPKELGEISIKLVMKDGTISGNILVENDNSKNILEKQLNEIKEELKNSNVNIDKLDINLSNDSKQNSNKENMNSFQNRKVKYNYMNDDNEIMTNNLEKYNVYNDGKLLSLYG